MIEKTPLRIELINGGAHVDKRGVLRFCNDFDASAAKRFYTVSNSLEYPIRGWIGHKIETKWFFPVKGVTVIEIESMGDSNDHTTNCCRLRFELAAEKPNILKVGPGNWLRIIQEDRAEVLVFSNLGVKESVDDDFRRS